MIILKLFGLYILGCFIFYLFALWIMKTGRQQDMIDFHERIGERLNSVIE